MSSSSLKLLNKIRSAQPQNVVKRTLSLSSTGLFLRFFFIVYKYVLKRLLNLLSSCWFFKIVLCIWSKLEKKSKEHSGFQLLFCLI